MTCQEIYKLLASQSEVSTLVQAEIEQHVNGCGTCKREWDEADSLTEQIYPMPRTAHLSSGAIVQLAEYVGGAISNDDKSAWRHLLMCDSCYREVASLRDGLHGLPSDVDKPLTKHAEQVRDIFLARQRSQTQLSVKQEPRYSHKEVTLPSSQTTRVDRWRWMTFQFPLKSQFSSRRMIGWVVATVLIVIVTGVSIYEAMRSRAVFAVVVTPQSIGTRSVMGDEVLISGDLISVPRDTRRIRFEVHPRNLRDGECSVALKIDGAVVETTRSQITAAGALYFELPAAKLKTGTYSIDLFPMHPAGETGSTETYRFQMLISR